MAEIAIVDDEKNLVNSLNLELTEMGHLVRPFLKAQPFLDYLKTTEPDLVFLDLKLPDINGLEVLHEVVNATSNYIPTIIITAHGNMESAIQALKGGAFDYINKPFDLDEISILIDKALKKVRLLREVEHRRERDYKGARLDQFIGSSPPVIRLLEMVQKLTAVDNTTVLLLGESGTGKDLLAKAIHNLSARASRQFIEVNCASFPENLLESELFGYEKGAFTDAKQRKTGLVELADGGTLFLDEVGDMPLSLQAKLLRFLENKSFRRVGGTSQIKVDVLIISATNRNLESAVEDKSFRKDLYYRLNVVPLNVPPLRERGEDIMTITQHYLDHFSHKFRKPIVQVTGQAREALLSYAWPGNVRELKNLMERLVILCNDGVIDLEILPTVIQEQYAQRDAAAPGRTLPDSPLEHKLSAFEKELISQALAQAGGVKTEAAQILGISRFALLRKIKRLFGHQNEPA
ncbi:MAG: sigma-54 dependent transcriptional regulator [Desulfarculaceae bacterium]